MKSDFLLAITQLAAERNLPKDLVLNAVKAALASTYKNYDVVINILASGEIKAVARKVVVQSVKDHWHEISLADAQKVKKGVQIGDTVEVEIDPLDAGRIGVQTAKQVVMQRLREAEHEFIFGTFAHRKGDVLSGVVQRVDARHVLIDLGQAEGVLPPPEQVRAEHYRPGQRLKVYLVEVEQTPKGPRLLLSRTHPNLVKRLFELEVPEIANGIVEIKAIAREPGSRTKIAVAAKRGEVDPVGACIGLRGIRIQNVTNEIQGEKIDVIQWDPDPKVFIANALSPAHVSFVKTDPTAGVAVVVVPDGQLSLAIGREGQNARLAAKLTDWKIDIKSASVAAQEGVRKVEEAPPPEEIEKMLEPVVEEAPVREKAPVAQPEVGTIELPEEVMEPVPSVPVEEAPAPGAPAIRFAEDVLPSDARMISSEIGKTKKKRAEKVKGKKKAVRRVLEDEEEIVLDYDDEFE